MTTKAIPPVCGESVLYNHRTGERKTFLCGRGRCENPTCRKKWVSRRIAIICNLVKEYDLRRFFTLGVTRTETLENAWQIIPHQWSLMRKCLARICERRGIPFHFIAVLEECDGERREDKQGDHYPHIHGFTNLWLDKEEWSRLWVNCGGGCATRIEGVTDDITIGDYVNKQIQVGRYVGKENVIGALKYMRRKSRTLWRSMGLKTALERDIKCLTLEADPCILREWSLEPVEVLGGEHEEKREGNDLEGAQ